MYDIHLTGHIAHYILGWHTWWPVSPKATSWTRHYYCAEDMYFSSTKKPSLPVIRAPEEEDVFIQ